jgi:hypothetical protein
VTRLFQYSAFGFSVSSQLELPQLPPQCFGVPDIEIRLGSVERSPLKANNADHIIFDNRIGAFHMKEGRQIIVDPAPGADPDLIKVVLTGRAMAFLIRQRGWLPLHGSSVSIRGAAALFLGPSGAGKSSMAAALRARGHAVVADDVAMVRTVDGICCVRPSSSFLRLTEDSMCLLEGNTEFRSEFNYDKSIVKSHQNALPEIVPVKRIYVLDFGEEFRIEELPPLLALATLSLHSFVKGRNLDPECLRAHVKQCAEVAKAVSMSQVTRRRAFSGLPELIDLVEREVLNRQ